MERNSCVCGMKIYFNLNSQGNEKLDFFSQETYDFQILENESVIVAGYEDIKASIFTIVRSFGESIFEVSVGAFWGLFRVMF